MNKLHSVIQEKGIRPVFSTTNEIHRIVGYEIPAGAVISDPDGEFVPRSISICRKCHNFRETRRIDYDANNGEITDFYLLPGYYCACDIMLRIATDFKQFEQYKCYQETCPLYAEQYLASLQSN